MAWNLDPKGPNRGGGHGEGGSGGEDWRERSRGWHGLAEDDAEKPKDVARSASHSRLETLFEGSSDGASSDDMARLFVMDKLTGMGAKSLSGSNLSGSNLLADRLGVGNRPLGKFDAQSGRWYRSATILPQTVREVGVEALMEALSDSRFNHQSQTGIVFNVVPHEREGMEVSIMCIGDSHVDVDGQLETALARVAELLASARSCAAAGSVAGFTLFNVPADAEAGKIKPEENVHAPAARAGAPTMVKMAGGGAAGHGPGELVAQDSVAGMTMFAPPAPAQQASTLAGGVAAQDSVAGLTMFASEGGARGGPEAADVTLDSACGMGLFSWNFEGMDEAEISKALSEADTARAASLQPSWSGSVPRMTPVGSMSSVVSALNDDDVLHLIEGCAGFTFFSRGGGASDAPHMPDDELVAAESSAGVTLFRRSSSRNLAGYDHTSVWAEETRGGTDHRQGTTRFSAADNDVRDELDVEAGAPEPPMERGGSWPER